MNFLAHVLHEWYELPLDSWENFVDSHMSVWPVSSLASLWLMSCGHLVLKPHHRTKWGIAALMVTLTTGERRPLCLFQSSIVLGCFWPSAFEAYFIKNLIIGNSSVVHGEVYFTCVEFRIQGSSVTLKLWHHPFLFWLLWLSLASIEFIHIELMRLLFLWLSVFHWSRRINYFFWSSGHMFWDSVLVVQSYMCLYLFPFNH